MTFLSPEDGAAQVRPGRWAVAVSGGADSVALLFLLRHRPDLALLVVHLDHETRGGESTADAKFVHDLARRLRLPSIIETRTAMEAERSKLPSGPSERYRVLRLALFRRVVETHDLQGVLVAHHADDVAETVLQRLLRGSGPNGLTGIAPQSRVAEVTQVRPLLSTRRDALRAYLQSMNECWREDASNASATYGRNRVRKMLAQSPGLTESLLEVAQASRALREWAAMHSPVLPQDFSMMSLADLPAILAADSAKRWLRRAGVPADELSPDVVGRLIEMANDAATPTPQDFPGGVRLCRMGGLIGQFRAR